MGGSSGGGISSIDLSKLVQAADARLRELARTGTRILFVSEREDRKSLNSHLSRSVNFKPEKIVVLDSTEREAALQAIDNCSVVVVFTNAALKLDFLNEVIESSLSKKKQGIHVKANDDSLIPSKAMAYRWPSLSWDKLEEIFTS